MNMPLPSAIAANRWTSATLSELADVDRGISYGIVQPGAHVNDGIPILRVNNLRGGRIDTTDVLRVEPEIESRYRRTRLRGGEILLTLVGSLGQCAVVPSSLVGWNVARAIGVIPVRDGVDPRWVKYCLQSAAAQHFVSTRATTTVQATLNLRDVNQISIPLPPAPERERITGILGSLDDKIELNRRMNQTLEAMARGIFKSWFIDFDPVRAKADGRQPPGLDPATAAMFPDRFEDSALGPIPKGWKVGTLGDIADNPRRAVQPSEVDADTAYIGLEHMPRRCIALGEWGHSDGLESGKFRFNRGDILFGKLRPYFHKVGVAPIGGVCSTDILVITPTEPQRFGLTLGYVSSNEFVSYTDSMSGGTKMPRTNWNDMARYEVVIPPPAIAKVHTVAVAPMIGQIMANIHQSRTLAAIRDALLPKLLSGELKVDNLQPTSGGASNGQTW